MLNYVFLVAGLILLIKGAGWLVRGAVTVARTLHISEFVIGLTVVSFATSLPELVIALTATAEDKPDLIIGNVIGSNIANILLVLGIAAVIYPLAATRRTISREMPFMLLSSFLLFALLNDQALDGLPHSVLGRTDGFALMALFCVFVFYIVQVIRSDTDRDWVGEQRHESMRRSIMEIAAGFASLAIGGYLTVLGAVQIASDAGLSEAFIGLTVVAIGTSLPELVTSAVAAYRRNADIAVGNVVGSNIFNIFIVLGISCLIKPIKFNPVNNIDVIVMLIATLLLYGATLVGRPANTIQRKEGALFVLAYFAYMVFLIRRG